MIHAFEAWQYVFIFLLGATPWVEIAVIIPLSIAAGLNPYLAAALAFLGNVTTSICSLCFTTSSGIGWDAGGARGKRTRSANERPRYGTSSGCPG